ncbi:response regulator transcription factor [Clostridium cadaveris]|uniref:response regulator transcription factor n=1 Tax=Clostridium cadaveris TaxID=1529 RepID=UPI001E4F6E0D|nr:response regulator transcription factor [Clostridium cadaveris]UFH65258.1 response regulator transcription factor [Clostridium cadaveris]
MNKILVIEDDSTIILGIKYSLEQEGFLVREAKSLEEARNTLRNEDFHLMLLDVMLPDGNGYEFCKEVREKSDIPIIFLTALDDEVNVVMGLDLGGDDYISKPFRLKELMSRINAVLRRRGISSEKNNAILNFNDISVFTLEGKVTKNGEDLMLTTLEYKLLLTLCKNPKAVLSRNQILASLWDFQGDFVNDNTLTVYIKRLREKIEGNPVEPKFILTVRGIGYKWDVNEGGNYNGSF